MTQINEGAVCFLYLFLQEVITKMSELLKLENEIIIKDTEHLPCRQGKFQVRLTPYDVYQIAESQNISSGEAIRRYAVFGIDPELRIPQLMFRPEYTGTAACPFMLGENGCALGTRRPDVCKMSPLERVYDQENSCVGFLLSDEEQDENADPVTVRDWICRRGAPMDCGSAEEWHQLNDTLSKAIAKHGDGITVDTVLLLYTLFPSLYTHYDMEEDFKPQFERNMRQLTDLVRKLKEGGEDHAGTE